MLALDTSMCEHISIQNGRDRSGRQGTNLQRELLWQVSLHWIPQHAQAQCHTGRGSDVVIHENSALGGKIQNALTQVTK